METSQIQQSIAHYKVVGIDISILHLDEVKGVGKIVVKQSRLFNGLILTGAQLCQRGGVEVFQGLDYTINITAEAFKPNLKDVTVEWILSKMKDFSVHRRDLISHLSLDKSTISLIFSKERGLTRFTKTAFFYYFLNYELNRDLRK